VGESRCKGGLATSERCCSGESVLCAVRQLEGGATAVEARWTRLLRTDFYARAACTRLPPRARWHRAALPGPADRTRRLVYVGDSDVTFLQWPCQHDMLGGKVFEAPSNL